MKYQGVCIAVKDINVSKRFYQELFDLKVYQDYGINVSFGGLSLQQEFDWLLGISKDKIKQEPHNMELYFEEDNFDEFIAKLHNRDGIRYLDKHAKEESWGQRSIKFYDPDGHIIEVGETLKMVVKRFLNTGMTLDEVSKRMDVSLQDLETLLK